MQVLDRLVDAQLMTPDERDAVEASFVIPVRVLRRPDRVSERTYYGEALRDYLLNRSDILGDSYQQRYTRLYRGGLRIHTTLDPVIQAQAEDARDQLPDNGLGIDAALTSIENKTGAIRAMVGGRGFIPGQREVNLALAPSQTGSSIKLFVLAAALQAGATPDDIVNGVRPCTLPNPGDPGNPTFTITGGVDGGIGTLRHQTELSINCAYSRLAQMVGLNRMVDTVYRMASSPYLYRGQPAEERFPIFPFGAFSIGANEMSTLDMAAGIQTIANEGVHMEPYFVEYIDDAAGNRIYTHYDPGTQVLDRQVALTAIDVLKGVLTRGTAHAELSGLASRQPAFGKTGTQEKNWTAFFVGATPFLSTAVMVRDPDRYTPMVGVAEFVDAGVSRVQGGTFPARIWGALMEAVGLERIGLDQDWDRPGPYDRGPARLYLPGSECVYDVVGFEPPTSEPSAEAAPPDPGADDVGAVDAPAGFRRAAPPSEPPPTGPPPTEPPPTTSTIPVTGTTTTTTAPPVTGTTTTVVAPATSDPNATTTTTRPGKPILAQGETGTTIAPDVLDPNAPLPSVPLSNFVGPCG
jgi:penicillin-binding protein 1A